MGYVATKSRPRYLDTDLKAEFAGDNPDYFDVKTNKWYSTSGGVSIGATLIIGSEITPRNYLNNIVYADHNGQPEYVEEVAKVEYKDIIKANEYGGKNACTAWLLCNRTIPISIYDEYNIGSVVKINAGLFRIYFKTKMDNVNYSISGTGLHDWSQSIFEYFKALDYVEIVINSRDGTYRETGNINLIIFGGKN